MPPRKAGPLSATSSPPGIKLTPSLIKKPSGLNVSDATKKVKKVFRFDYEIDCDEPETNSSFNDNLKDSNLTESIPEKTKNTEDECTELSEEQLMEEVLRLEQMYDVFSNLNRECQERMRSVRLDAGEIIDGKTPTSSQQSGESNCSFEFDLDLSSATDDVRSDDIFAFIWDYIQDHQRDIYRRIGTGTITRDMAENYLKNAPRDLLQILEISLVEAERKLNQFSV